MSGMALRDYADGGLTAEDLRGELLRAWELLDVSGSGDDAIGGQLLRPRMALSVAGEAQAAALGTPFWLALLAVQLAHEASLLHDDVVDGSDTRRGCPTLTSRRGVAAALVAGDQLLARAYLAAARTGSWEFVRRFTRAIDQTIAGERAQGEAAGRRLELKEMRDIIRAKSGELFGCALSAAASLSGHVDAEVIARLGREVGVLYQKVDDLLDYCPGAGTGKPPFADLNRDLWTWPRSYLPEGAPPVAFFLPHDGGVPARLALEELEADARHVLAVVEGRFAHAEELQETIRAWLARASGAVLREVAEASISMAPPASTRESAVSRASAVPRAFVLPGESSVPPESTMPRDAAAVLAHHGRTFHFATRLMPEDVRGRIARVYAVCRTLDDTVDEASDRHSAQAGVRELLSRARSAYHGTDEVWRDEACPLWMAMREMREAEVPFAIFEQLAEGVRMDLWPRRYADLDELRVYTHRVAGVVGVWFAGLAGCRDGWALSLAGELGHAMQLTNIARDVGEDLGRGRVYLPLDLLGRHGLSEERLRAAAASAGPVPPEFAAALEELMGWADAGYGAAFQAIPHLPDGYRRAVAVAARVYQGIHGAIRRNGYDTLRLRARTGAVEKAVLGFASLRELNRAESRRRA